jgi:CubicO group peptidase (beta-lactamase class C family)
MASRFDPVWRALDDTVADGWAPGIVAGLRHRGETEVYATGTVAFESPRLMHENTPFRIASLSKLVAGALATLMLDDGLFELDDDVDHWLPELALPRVLVTPDGPLDQTVAAHRSITVRDLLTMTHGLGVIFDDSPISNAMRDTGVLSSALPVELSPDQFMERLGTLPLAHQPGERWMYNLAADILGVLLARVSGGPLHEVLAARIFEPLGMSSTGFQGDPATLPTAYQNREDTLVVFDKPDGVYSRTPIFESLAGGLISTVPDYLRFLTALEDGLLLPAALKEQMTTDRLRPSQKEGTELMLGGGGAGWGWQVGIVTSGDKPGQSKGSYGWTGGTGTRAFVDPSHDLIGVVFTQRLMSGPLDDFAYFMDPVAALS